MTDIENLSLSLTRDEQDILKGDHGPVMQKVMKSVVLYGEALGAKRLVDIEGDGHFVISYAIPGIAPSMEMLEELVSAGTHTKYPFTLDPKPPLDYENWWLRSEQVQLLQQMYQEQERYEGMMLHLGLRDPDAWTCTPYLPQVDNIPNRDEILAWSESACAIYANSVLGARTNKNGAIMDLLCGIVGKAPLAGLLTEGPASYLVNNVKHRRTTCPSIVGCGYWDEGSGRCFIHCGA